MNAVMSQFRQAAKEFVRNLDSGHEGGESCGVTHDTLSGLVPEQLSNGIHGR